MDKDNSLLLIDLDDTLVDTSSLKDNLFSDLALLGGVSVAEIEKIYQRMQPQRSEEDWLELTIQSLAQELGQKVATISQVFEDNISQLSINPAVISFIQNFDGYTAILSYGNTKYQWKKIHTLHLEKIVDDVIITMQDKVQLLASMILDNQVVIKDNHFRNVTIIDNDQYQLDQINTLFPWISAINVKELING